MAGLLHPFIGFLVGYVGLVATSIATRRAVLGLLVLVALYAALSATPSQLVEGFYSLLSWNDVRVFVFVFLSMFLAGLLRERGVLDALVDATSSVGCRFGLLAVPSIIGMLPMPGGALVSAIAMRKKYFSEARLGAEQATFLNYWFRHVWVPSWPLFQSVVITASVFSLDPAVIVAHTWPGTLAAIAGGLLVAYTILRGVTCSRGSQSALLALLKSLWPFILLGVLVFSSGLGLLYSLLATIAAVVIVLRPSTRDYKGALRLATRPVIHLVLFEALLFKNLLVASGGPEAILGVLSSTGMPVVFLVFLLPFVLGLSAGGENFFAATAMPLLAPTIASGSGYSWPLLYLAYSGGFLGVMLSPVHLCLVLTVEYYRASMGRVLGMVAAATAASTLLVYVISYPLLLAW